ncbi:MAG: DnaA N-terminal domain-containing protein, partial [Ignavibacteria bacterium]
MSNIAAIEKSLIVEPRSECQSAWKECLKTIKENVTQMTFNTWFLPIKPFELNNSVLKIQLPSQFFWEWIDEHYNTLINRTIRQVLGESARLAYIISEEKETEEPEHIRSEEKIKEQEFTLPKKDFETFLNPRYTFNNFIKGEGNQLAR